MELRKKEKEKETKKKKQEVQRGRLWEPLT
jgi:hypothetical protein